MPGIYLPESFVSILVVLIFVRYNLLVGFIGHFSFLKNVRDFFLLHFLYPGKYHKTLVSSRTSFHLSKLVHLLEASAETMGISHTHSHTHTHTLSLSLSNGLTQSIKPSDSIDRSQTQTQGTLPHLCGHTLHLASM
jgi:hypothetical protein